MNTVRIKCLECGKVMYSLGYARHAAMHRDERIKAENQAKESRRKKQQPPPSAP